MKDIIYLEGDATDPKDVNGKKIIFHIVNSIGAWGAGFVLALSKKWKEPEAQYDKWFRSSDFKLGNIQFVKINCDLVVCNMLAQESVGYKDGVAPIRYNALDECLRKLSVVAKKHDASVVGPRIGCRLAGGKWEKIEPLIIKNLSEKDVQVYIYDLE